MRRLAALLALSGLAWGSDDLPRHAVIGLVVGPGETSAAEVLRVVPGSAGEAAGFAAGDVIASLDGVAIQKPDQFVRGIGRHLGGDSVQVGIVREGQPLLKTAKLQPRPLETSSYADVQYLSVTVRGSRRRVI